MATVQQILVQLAVVFSSILNVILFSQIVSPFRGKILLLSYLICKTFGKILFVTYSS